MSRTDTRSLNIEVKSSIQHINGAKFHISRHEWDSANATLNYAFYLWLLQTSLNKLCVLEKKTVEPHVPTDNLTGVWQDVEIPFKEFETRFSVA